MGNEYWLTTVVLFPMRLAATILIFVFVPVLWPLSVTTYETRNLIDELIRGTWRR